MVQSQSEKSLFCLKILLLHIPLTLSLISQPRPGPPLASLGPSFVPVVTTHKTLLTCASSPPPLPDRLNKHVSIISVYCRSLCAGSYPSYPWLGCRALGPLGRPRRLTIDTLRAVGLTMTVTWLRLLHGWLLGLFLQQALVLVPITARASPRHPQGASHRFGGSSYYSETKKIEPTRYHSKKEAVEMTASATLQYILTFLIV